jgi:ABC-type polysaccharide/polyol phosphate transport system ATPase subunit
VSSPNGPRIEVEAVGKRYCTDLDRSLRYGVADLVRAVAGRRPPAGLRRGEFWAVDGVSLELGSGECLGIVGANGAGKSTLLALMQGRTPPDRGEVRVRGRLAAMTELGQGFDEVLSGRENARAAAALAGLGRAATERLNQRIEAFAELGAFFDAPVFTYSAGMKARLGYAVAALTDPDILLIDEVLAVGDLAFRRKCVQHIAATQGRGAAVALVSHDMYTVQSLCSRALWIERGRVAFAGTARETVARYLESRRLEEARAPAESARPQHARQPSEREPIVLVGAALRPVEGAALAPGRPAEVVVRYRALAPRPVFWGFRIATADLLVQIASAAFPDGYAVEAGEGELVGRIPSLPLTAGTYALRAAIAEPGGGALLALLGFDDPPPLFDVRGGPPGGASYELMSGDLVILDVESAG